jgi:hypothetical protein
MDRNTRVLLGGLIQVSEVLSHFSGFVKEFSGSGFVKGRR